MSGYASQEFGQRIGQMGDQAEGLFENLGLLGRANRYGWNRVATSAMPRNLANTPDYVTSTGDLVEVMGCTGTLFRAMKVDKWESMKAWNTFAEGRLSFFIFNSGRQTWVLLSYEKMKRLVGKARKRGIKAFPDGNEYYEILWKEVLELADMKGAP